MNVLTIDIDYVFSPYISTYDDYVIGSRITIHEQKKILLNHGFENPKINEKKFKNLKNIFKNIFKSSIPIKLIQHHHEAIKYIPKKEEIILQNIDHHHDIYYPDWHELDKLDEGNWIYHLSKSHNLKRYDWFKNNDSEPYCNCISLNFDFIEYLELKSKYVLNPDIIILCSSPHWTYDEKNLIIDTLIGGFKNENKKI